MLSERESDELDQLLKRLVTETRHGQAASYKKLLETLAPMVRRSAASLLVRCGPVSYTHLDVYKRQTQGLASYSVANVPSPIIANRLLKVRPYSQSAFRS